MTVPILSSGDDDGRRPRYEAGRPLPVTGRSSTRGATRRGSWLADEIFGLDALRQAHRDGLFGADGVTSGSADRRDDAASSAKRGGAGDAPRQAKRSGACSPATERPWAGSPGPQRRSN